MLSAIFISHPAHWVWNLSCIKKILQMLNISYFWKIGGNFLCLWKLWSNRNSHHQASLSTNDNREHPCQLALPCCFDEIIQKILTQVGKIINMKCYQKSSCEKKQRPTPNNSLIRIFRIWCLRKLQNLQPYVLNKSFNARHEPGNQSYRPRKTIPGSVDGRIERDYPILATFNDRCMFGYCESRFSRLPAPLKSLRSFFKDPPHEIGDHHLMRIAESIKNIVRQ